MIRTLFTNAMTFLEKNLDLRLTRHQVLTSNIANAETPGYIAKDVRFEDALQEAASVSPANPLARTHPRHLPHPPQAVSDVQGTLVASPSADVGRDLNTVSVDQEMAKFTTNMFHYNASIEILSRLLDQTKRTISEGGR